MRKVWVVVANRGQMRLYQAENVHTLIERETLIHAESHLHRNDGTETHSFRGGRKCRSFFCFLKINGILPFLS